MKTIQQQNQRISQLELRSILRDMARHSQTSIRSLLWLAIDTGLILGFLLAFFIWSLHLGSIAVILGTLVLGGLTEGLLLLLLWRRWKKWQEGFAHYLTMLIGES